MIIIKRKKSFTLIELLLVITLIASVGCGMGVGLYEMYQSHVFNASMSLLKQKIKLAEEAGFDYDTEMIITLKQGDEGIALHTSPPAFMAPHLQKVLNHKNTFKGVKKFSFQGIEKNNLVLRFYPYSGWEPKGKLVFTSFQKKDFPLDESFLEGLPPSSTPHYKIYEAPYPKEIQTLLSTS
jgi:hypothetical protein